MIVRTADGRQLFLDSRLRRSTSPSSVALRAPVSAVPRWRPDRSIRALPLSLVIASPSALAAVVAPSLLAAVLVDGGVAGLSAVQAEQTARSGYRFPCLPGMPVLLLGGNLPVSDADQVAVVTLVPLAAAQAALLFCVNGLPPVPVGLAMLSPASVLDQGWFKSSSTRPFSLR